MGETRHRDVTGRGVGRRRRRRPGAPVLAVATPRRRGQSRVRRRPLSMTVLHPRKKTRYTKPSNPPRPHPRTTSSPVGYGPFLRSFVSLCSDWSPVFFFPFFFTPPPPSHVVFSFFFRTGDATTPRRGVTGAVVAGKRAALVDWLPRAHDSSCVCASACGDLLKIEIGRENTERERVRGCCHGCRRRFETGGSQRPIRAVDRRPARRTRLAANQSRRRASFAWDASRRLDAARVPSSMSALGAVHSRVDGDESLLLLLLLLWSIGVVGNHLRRVRRRHGLGSSLSGDSAQNQGDSARRGPSRPCGT